MAYKIVRFFQDDRPSQTISVGHTLEEAQEHCRDESTHGDGWFDGYDAELPGEAAEWIHDAQRDGAGCGWCGSFAQVNADNECRECFV